MPTVSEPATVEQAASEIRRAATDGVRVSIDREGGDVVLSTRGLDRILEHEAGDLTCTVEAGIRLSTLNAYLAPFGQMLGLDPPGDPTVGACLAGNLSGPRRHRYGAPRDLVLGVTVVLGDGTVAHSGGKVVKNVAGYDLGKLFCGSRGTFGLIARASLRLHPRPAETRTLVVRFATAEDAERKAQTVHRSTLVPSAVDVLWPDRLALLLEGSRRAVDAQVAQAGALVGGDEDGTVWEEVAERQTAAKGVVSLLPWRVPEDDALPLRRLGAGVAYSTAPVPPVHGAAALVERIRNELDPTSVLA